MSEDRMPKFNQAKDLGTSKNILEYMKIIEKENIERVLKLQRIRRNNVITGLTLGGLVFGIYGYSIYSVKQESFLDDFDEPTTKEI